MHKKLSVKSIRGHACFYASNSKCSFCIFQYAALNNPIDSVNASEKKAETH